MKILNKGQPRGVARTYVFSGKFRGGGGGGGGGGGVVYIRDIASICVTNNAKIAHLRLGAIFAQRKKEGFIWHVLSLKRQMGKTAFGACIASPAKCCIASKRHI